MKKLDFFDILSLKYAGLNEVQLLSGKSKEDSCHIFNHLKELAKYKGLHSTNEEIPMSVLVEYLNIDLNRVKRYHDELDIFYNFEDKVA